MHYRKIHVNLKLYTSVLFKKKPIQNFTKLRIRKVNGVELTYKRLGLNPLYLHHYLLTEPLIIKTSLVLYIVSLFIEQYFPRLYCIVNQGSVLALFLYTFMDQKVASLRILRLFKFDSRGEKLLITFFKHKLLKSAVVSIFTAHLFYALHGPETE